MVPCLGDGPEPALGSEGEDDDNADAHVIRVNPTLVQLHLQSLGNAAPEGATAPEGNASVTNIWRRHLQLRRSHGNGNAELASSQ